MNSIQEIFALPTWEERITLIKLTKKGDALKEDCKDIPPKVSSVVSDLSMDEIETLYNLLYKIV